MALCVADITADNCNEVFVGYEDGYIRVAGVAAAPATGAAEVQRASPSDRPCAGAWGGLDGADFADIAHVKLPFPIVSIEFGQLVGHQVDEAKCGGGRSVFHQQLVVCTTQSVHVYTLLHPRR
jgi:hypothetical protein